MSYTALLIRLLPETVVLVTGLLVLALDLSWLRGRSLAKRTRIAVVLSLIGLIGAVICSMCTNQTISFFDGMLVLDPLTRF